MKVAWPAKRGTSAASMGWLYDPVIGRSYWCFAPLVGTSNGNVTLFRINAHKQYVTPNRVTYFSR
jgi:hypothetical protein